VGGKIRFCGLGDVQMFENFELSEAEIFGSIYNHRILNSVFCFLCSEFS
jgi:hypothetical protein